MHILYLEWYTTGKMSATRKYLTASVLQNGKVLVSGGYNENGYLDSAELYDPSTGLWTATGQMSTTRKGHTASVLSNGKVLVSGGCKENSCLDSAELY
jgi:N-acetylneuraminic acid mutarotase